MSCGLMVPTRMKKSRKVAGGFLILTPLVVVVALPFVGVLLGSLGMDIHWNASKTLFYIAIVCFVLMLLVCLKAGVRIRRDTKTSK
jgi:protein-S-isoprenylcysteine O-methyltransferase Ste14